MLHKAWNSKGEMPYCFPRSSVKFQGHTVQNITDFDPNWAFPDYRPVAAFKSLRFALFLWKSLYLERQSWYWNGLLFTPLQSGCSVNVANQKGNTPLHDAARWSSLVLVELLVKHDADGTLRNRQYLMPIQLTQVGWWESWETWCHYWLFVRGITGLRWFPLTKCH